MTHIQFRRQLVKELVGNFREGIQSIRKERPSSSDQEERLNGKLHIIIPHPKGKHKVCIVCSKRKIPGGRRETTYICKTCMQTGLQFASKDIILRQILNSINLYLKQSIKVFNCFSAYFILHCAYNFIIKTETKFLGI